MPLKDVAKEPQAVWDALQAGNQRFVLQQQERPNQDIVRRTELRDGIAEGSCGIVGLRYKLSDGSVEHVIADGVE